MKQKELIPECRKARVFPMMLIICLLLSVMVFMPQILSAKAGFRRLPVAEYRDKMKGAWLGQMIGVGWGRPTEKGPVHGHFSTEGYIMSEERMPP